MGSIYAEMSCSHVETIADSWPLSPPNRWGCERGTRGAVCIYLAQVDTLFLLDTVRDENDVGMCLA
jgi:hypothetical protein